MKVLVVRLSSFGDQIHVCPAVSDLKRQRPDFEIHWLTQSEFAAVPQAHRSVSKVFTVPLTTLKKYPFRLAIWREFFRTIKKLRSERYAVAIDVHGVIKSALLVFVSGAKTRVGFGKGGVSEGLAYWAYQRHFVHTPGKSSVGKLRDFVRWAFDLKSLGADIDFGLSLKLQGVKNKNGVLFAPFASHPSKMLPLSCWAELASALLTEAPTLEIRVSWGSEQEYESAKLLEQSSSNSVKPNFKRFESAELLTFLAGHQLVVGVDTGIMQLANALGVPTVMIFSASSPTFYFSPGSPLSTYVGSAEGPPTKLELQQKVMDTFRECFLGS